MKTVFNNSMTAHVWAQLKQSSGRNSTNSLAYSYAQPVAHIVKALNGQTIALFTSRKWSHTTSQHVSDYRRAVSNEIPQFTVPDLFRYQSQETDTNRFDHTQNVEHFVSMYNEEVKALMRCPATSRYLENLGDENYWYGDNLPMLPLSKRTRVHASLYRRYELLTNYCNAFSIPAPALSWIDDADKVISRRDRLLNDPKAKAKREANRVARETAEKNRREALAKANTVRMENDKAQREAWLRGENVSYPYSWRYNSYNEGAELRVRDKKIETSMGAECPVLDAILAIRFWRTAIDSGAPQDWDLDQHQSATTLGEFRLDRIYPNGDIKAGCHLIKRSEIERLETLLK